MANEITVYQAITTAGQAVKSIADTVKGHKIVRKQDVAVMQEQLRYIKASCRIKAQGELTRLSFDEMEKTLEMLTQKNFPADMQAMATELLTMQFAAMKHTLQNFMRD